MIISKRKLQNLKNHKKTLSFHQNLSKSKSTLISKKKNFSIKRKGFILEKENNWRTYFEKKTKEKKMSKIKKKIKKHFLIKEIKINSNLKEKLKNFKILVHNLNSKKKKKNFSPKKKKKKNFLKKKKFF